MTKLLKERRKYGRNGIAFAVPTGISLCHTAICVAYKCCKKRQLEPNIINIIIVLCIVSLFIFGISWLVALIMAYVWPTKDEVEIKRKREEAFIGGKDQESRNLDKLTQLADLYKQGFLTKEEFETKKKQLLGGKNE